VGAGALLSRIGNIALEESLTGFEFAAGIPGTIGGAVVMNAGAYGGEMKDVLETVTVLTPEGEVLVLQNEELELGYRTSIIPKKDYIVLGAVIKLAHGDKDAIKEKMTELKIQRTTKQPLEYPSAGSTFKRPVGYFAGKLIQDAGLRGFQVGGAQVSEKHCGFVINKDNATAADIVELMKQVSEIVKEKFGVELEAEVKRLGEF
jgi:UDP-N-acetylmuramate dehydrogenase